MDEIYKIIDANHAVQELQRISKVHKKTKIHKINLERGTSEKNDKENIEEIIREAKTIILNKDIFFAHIQCYTCEQNIEDIKREGVMYDVIYSIG
jgi:hypothetical protein